METFTIANDKFVSLSWEDVERLTDRLASSIAERFYPDTLVGILRGGMIVANLLSDLLDLKEVYPIGGRSYIGIGQRVEVKIYHNLYLNNLKERYVLLVDDVSDTGNTLTTAVDHILKPREPSKLKTATLHVKPKTSFFPDFYAEIVDAWIIYPWERNETVRLLAPKLLEASDEENAVKRLSRLARVDEEDVRKIIARTNK